jgi:hypothetical protein
LKGVTLVKETDKGKQLLVLSVSSNEKIDLVYPFNGLDVHWKLA